MTTQKGSNLVLVDFSGWVEYAASESRADKYAPFIENTRGLLIPTIVLYEVYKKLLVTRGESFADRFISQALRAQVVGLDADLAQAAVQASIKYRLAMADAIIYATARNYEAQLVTSDTHFQGLPGVTLI